MTSTASQQNPLPAPNTSSVAAPSYASAAGSTKKPNTTTPVIGSGPNPAGPPVVVGSAQNGKPAPSPVNGRPSIITPAVPAAPAVVRSSANVNGAGNHDRKSSVTIPPNTVTQNGGPVGGAIMPKFGFDQSPAIVHSTPQPGAAPIPIPGSNARIPSPVHSPTPIPQHSGGQQRPPSTQGSSLTFGSFPGDTDRSMKQPPVNKNHMPMGSPLFPHNNMHHRNESQNSNQADFGHAGPPHGRGGFGGGRGRGGGYSQYPNMAFGTNQQYGGRGRGGNMPFQGPNRMQAFPSSPSQARVSPASAPAIPHGTPTMSAVPIPSTAPYYPPAYPHQQMQNPQAFINQYVPPLMNYNQFSGQTVQPYMPPPAQPNPQAFHQPYPSAQFSQNQLGGQPMSRNSSQISERPASSTGPSQPMAAAPVAQSTPQPRTAQVAPPVVSSSGNFSRPVKSSKIVIKNDKGEVVDLPNFLASPAPSIQSKTPPVVTSTPTPPPPKPSTPSHARSESTAAKTAEQLRNEFKDLVADAKAREEEAAKAAAQKSAKETQDKEKEEERLKEERLKEERLKEEAKHEAERVESNRKKAEEDAQAAKAAAEAATEAREREKADAEAKLKAEADAASKTAAVQKEARQEMDDDEMERMIREMEEEDARREKEQAAITAKKEAEKAEKKKAEAELANPADADRKLREQEAEMERYEEERERKRREREAQAGSGESMADLLTKGLDELSRSEKKDSMPDTPNSISDKLGSLSISGDGASAANSRANAAEKQRAKPAALNLTPLNTKQVEPPQPSAAVQSLKSARFLTVLESHIYPPGIRSPNPALNKAVSTKGKSFKYDAAFLLQFQKVFTEQPSMEFHQQVKSLIGDPDARSVRTPSGAGSGRQGSQRAGGAAFPSQGGAMGQFGARTLPPGTTSQDRFMASNGGSISAVGRGSMASFGRSGAFPGATGMSRTPSSSNIGGIPHSPRQGSRSQRNNSRRDNYSKADDKGGKGMVMPLTAGQDLKPIAVTASGWKPTSIGRSAQASASATGPSGNLDPEMVQRKVKAALNKMTPEKFDRIADQILVIASQSKNEQDGRTLRQVIQLTFEKATDEAHWASMYAKFCERMLKTMSPDIRDENILDKSGQVVNGGALFRKYLLNRCQEEFERGWKVDLPESSDQGDKKAQEAALLSDEYYIAAAAKRRGLGLVQFIGELYKLGMLTERIMHECVRKLLEFQGMPDEAEIESLTKLLRTIGANLDNTDKGHPMMDAYFTRINSILELPELPSRLKFMLMDVVDLRRARWIDSRDVNKGPKTLEEVRVEAEAQAALKAQENAQRSNQRGQPGGRPQGGRGDARQFSSYNQAPPNSHVGADDLRRLKNTTRSASQNLSSFGPSAMFNSRSNSGRAALRLPRTGEESGASSRTGTPPTRGDSIAHHNAFGALAMAGDGEHPASPPSASASPALAKATLEPAVKAEAKED